MKGRPTDRYEPGELHRTRRNIGDVPAEEARRLSQILGGEVGVERSSAEIEQKYGQLQERNRSRSDGIRKKEAPRTQADRSSTAVHRFGGELTYEQAHASASRPTPPYRDLVRMSFQAAKPEHGVKTLGGAIASVFSFALPVKDSVNPQFIIRGNELYFRHIENLVTSVRTLLAINRRNPINRLRNPFFVRILDILKNWDIEALRRELTHLQIVPRNLSFRFCGTLTRLMYGPILRLIELEEEYHVASALKRLRDLCMLSHPKGHPEAERIKRHYHQAAEELEAVFFTVKYRCYPLLMKLSSVSYSPPESFFETQRNEILAYLGLGKEDIVLPPSPSAAADPVAEPEEGPDIDQRRILDTVALQKGLEILERLFPGAGWGSLDSFPDLYPYFQPLCSFPRGAELISHRDPLHQIFMLAHILQELFRGFRQIEFGYLWHENGTQIDIEAQIGAIFERWRVLLDEVIGKRYLSSLNELCRVVERNPRFVETPYGNRVLHDLTWMKKTLALPHMRLRRGAAAEIDPTTPRLHELSSELCDILIRVARDLGQEETSGISSITNPWEPFSFEFDSPVSHRFREVLRLYREATNNANLVLYTFAVALVLDSLINNPESFFYTVPPDEVYRKESPDGTAPQYAVVLLDPRTLFREADRKVPTREKREIRPPKSTSDRLTGVMNEAGLRAAIQEEIRRYRRERVPFAVLSLTVRRFDEYVEATNEERGVVLLKKTAGIISESIGDYVDRTARLEDSLFAVLLPKTVKEEAVSFAVRLLGRFTKENDPTMPISIGIVPFLQTWGPDKMIRVARRAAEEAAQLPAPSFSIYDELHDSYETKGNIRM